jgi:DNA-binding NtrC family response regulator
MKLTVKLVGESAPMRELYSRVSRIADTETSVLLAGESETGKELAARALHQKSRRSEAPFVAVDCAALPEALLESELFGHKKGAFTDARNDRKGLLQQADTGTAFFDEIGDLPLPLQPKLLRALEERRVRPVGGEKLAVEDLPEKIRSFRRSYVFIGSDDPGELATMEDVERRYISHVIKAVSGNRTRASEILGLDRKTLYRKMKQYGNESDETS